MLDITNYWEGFMMSCSNPTNPQTSTGPIIYVYP